MRHRSQLSRLSIVAVAFAASYSAGCGPTSDVTISPPRVPQGGRAVAISVSQSDAKRLIVATESGGLFRTFNAGASFQHLDLFPTIYAVDVAIASLDPNTIIATAKDDFTTVSGGGIWRSTDGGASWTRPAGWPPSGCGGRPGARGISHMPLTRTFYVATDCGLSVSNDNGASFTTTAIDPANKMLFSVLVVNRTTGVATDSKRVWYLNNGQWTPSLGGPDDGGVLGAHQLASPYWAAPNIFYHAGRDRHLWVSTTSGGAWRPMVSYCDTTTTDTTLTSACDNREPFVRVARGLDGNPTHFDVYFGDGVKLWREATTSAVPSGPLADWRQLSSDHSDPADIGFTPGFELPLMLATDGGVHITSDKGKTWKLTGANFGGFVALQVGEMTGLQVGGSSPHLDLYFGTQDNSIRASSDGGATWPGATGGEGAFLQVDRANPQMVDGPVTGRSCGACILFDLQAHLSGSGRFKNAPDANIASTSAHAPFQLLGPNYLQPVIVPPRSEYWLTGDRGASWDSSFSTDGRHVGNILFSGDLNNPVAYVAIEKNKGAKLLRASNVGGASSVRPADSVGMGTIGLLRTGQARYAVVGVDPKNPDRLIAEDIDFPAGMKQSTDGGMNWSPMPLLDSVASDNKRFRMVTTEGTPFMTTVAWDPTNSCHILVGTMQNGVIRSADGGRTWSQVAGSKFATIVTSFFFPPTGPIWMSTYGRGLWRINVDRSAPPRGRCVFPPRPPGPIEPSPPQLILRTGGSRPFKGLADSSLCPTCTVLLVHDGWITEVDGDQEVKSIAISGGYVEQRRRDGRETPVTVPNRSGNNELGSVMRRLGKVTPESRVRGLILDGTRLVGFITSSEPLPIAPSRKPSIFTQSLSGESIQVLGFQFLPGTGERGVTLMVEGDTVATGIHVGANGRFDYRMKSPPLPPGWVELTAQQRDGLRTTVATTSLQIVDR